MPPPKAVDGVVLIRKALVNRKGLRRDHLLTFIEEEVGVGIHGAQPLLTLGVVVVRRRWVLQIGNLPQADSETLELPDSGMKRTRQTNRNQRPRSFAISRWNKEFTNWAQIQVFDTRC